MWQLVDLDYGVIGRKLLLAVLSSYGKPFQGLLQ
jgi:hypothetical protein